MSELRRPFVVRTPGGLFSVTVDMATKGADVGKRIVSSLWV